MNKQLAGKIGISEITVKIHRGNLNEEDAREVAAELCEWLRCWGARRGFQSS